MSTVTSRDGTPIAYEKTGHGEPVILVDGALCWRGSGPSTPLAKALADRFTVYTYDRRGRGQSGNTEPYSTDREVDDLEALIAAAGGSAHVYAISSGVALALDAASRGVPIRKLALYEPPFIVDDSHPRAPKDFAAHLNELVAAGRRGDAVDYWNTVIGMPAEVRAQMRQSPWWPGQEAIAHTLAYDATIVQDTQQGSPAPLRQWASVSAPTLVMDGTTMMGREDLHAFMRHGADALANVLPNAQRRTLEGQDHGPADDALAPALQAFFLG
jgi:pimeloyl-ACP methyl ester carboxylesterase